MSQSRPQAILFADVSGSTQLFETKGDVEARRLIASVLDALGVVSERHGGRVVKTIGDEIMCALPSALDGLLAACDMQGRIAGDSDFARDKVAVHIGCITATRWSRTARSMATPSTSRPRPG